MRIYKDISVFVEKKKITDYLSFIWTDRYNTVGDFEMIIPYNKTNAAFYKKDQLVTCNLSEKIMIIENIQISISKEDGKILKVTGRSYESILDRRVVPLFLFYDPYYFDSDKFMNAFKNIINITFGLQNKEQVLTKDSSNPLDDRYKNGGIYDANRVYELLVNSIDPENRILNSEINMEVTGKSVLALLEEYCQVKGFGFKLIDNTLTIYDGKNIGLIFSVENGFIESLDYLSSKENYKNVAYIQGDEYSSSKNLVEVANVTYDLDQLSEEGKVAILTSDDTDDETLYYRAKVDLANKPALERREVYIESSKSIGQNSNSKYVARLQNEGRSELINNYSEKNQISVEMTHEQSLEYMKDYILGDIIYVAFDSSFDIFDTQNSTPYTKKEEMQISEVTISHSPSGLDIYPTFTLYDPDAWANSNRADLGQDLEDYEPEDQAWNKYVQVRFLYNGGVCSSLAGKIFYVEDDEIANLQKYDISNWYVLPEGLDVGIADISDVTGVYNYQQRGDYVVFPDDEPTKEHYTFKGWFLNGKKVEPHVEGDFDTGYVIAKTGDDPLIFTALWDIDVHEITWDCGSGGHFAANIDGNTITEKYAYGSTPNPPQVFADNGYHEDSPLWQPNIVPVEGDTTYTAHWVENEISEDTETEEEEPEPADPESEIPTSGTNEDKKNKRSTKAKENDENDEGTSGGLIHFVSTLSNRSSGKSLGAKPFLVYTDENGNNRDVHAIIKIESISEWAYEFSLNDNFASTGESLLNTDTLQISNIGTKLQNLSNEFGFNLKSGFTNIESLIKTGNYTTFKSVLDSQRSGSYKIYLHWFDPSGRFGSYLDHCLYTDFRSAWYDSDNNTMKHPPGLWTDCGNGILGASLWYSPDPRRYVDDENGDVLSFNILGHTIKIPISSDWKDLSGEVPSYTRQRLENSSDVSPSEYKEYLIGLWRWDTTGGLYGLPEVGIVPKIDYIPNYSYMRLDEAVENNQVAIGNLTGTPVFVPFRFFRYSSSTGYTMLCFPPSDWLTNWRSYYKKAIVGYYVGLCCQLYDQNGRLVDSTWTDAKSSQPPSRLNASWNNSARTSDESVYKQYKSQQWQAIKPGQDRNIFTVIRQGGYWSSHVSIRSAYQNSGWLYKYIPIQRFHPSGVANLSTLSNMESYEGELALDVKDAFGNFQNITHPVVNPNCTGSYEDAYAGRLTHDTGYYYNMGNFSVSSIGGLLDDDVYTYFPAKLHYSRRMSIDLVYGKQFKKNILDPPIIQLTNTGALVSGNRYGIATDRDWYGSATKNASVTGENRISPKIAGRMDFSGRVLEQINNVIARSNSLAYFTYRVMLPMVNYAVNVRWLVSDSSGSTWYEIPGAHGNSLKIRTTNKTIAENEEAGLTGADAIIGTNGSKYKQEVTVKSEDEEGWTTTSGVGTLTVSDTSQADLSTIDWDETYMNEGGTFKLDIEDTDDMFSGISVDDLSDEQLSEITSMYSANMSSKTIAEKTGIPESIVSIILNSIMSEDEPSIGN